MYLIIRLQGADDETLPEKDRPDPILQISHAQHKNIGVNWHIAEELLADEGYELAPALGRHPKTEWPITAIAYTSQSQDGVGRSGSQIHRWAVRKKEEKLPSMNPCDDCEEHICGKCLKRDRMQERENKLLVGLENLGWPCQLEDLAEYTIKLDKALGYVPGAKACIIRLYQQSKKPGDERAMNEYRQGLRDALEALKKYGVIKDYDLSGEE